MTPEEQEKFPPIAPDFVLELMSPSDSLQETRAKMQEYMNNGVKLGWLINQKMGQVEIYRLGKPVEILDFPQLQRFWVVDYRIFNPDADGKTKIDHVKDMLQNLVYHKLLPFDTVLLDTWYAVHNLMLYIDSLDKIYYCPLKENRLVDDTFGKEKYEVLNYYNGVKKT